MVQISSSSASMAAPTSPAFIRLLAWALLCVGMPMLLLHLDKPKPVSAQVPGHVPVPEANVNAASEGIDVGALIAQLRVSKPDYIGIGNSMLFTRLGRTQKQIEEMNELTGRKFYMIVSGGSTTAAWYLTLKNVVAASGIHPKLVFFFLRDTELTSPLANTIGKHAAYLNSLREPQEPVVDDLLRPPSLRDGFIGGSIDRVSMCLTGPGGLYDLSSLPGKVHRRLTNFAIKSGGGRLLKDENRQVLSERFSLERLRADVPADIAAANSDNDEAFDPYERMSTNYVNPEARSFLPPMMQVAREHGLKLLFFRVKKRPETQDGTVTGEPLEMRGYVQRLRHWIEEREGLFFDETYDPAIRLEAYNDGDHIGEEHLDWYRRYFWQRMCSVFP